MAGYKKNAEYEWRIELGGPYAQFKATAKKAHEVFEELQELVGDHVTIECLDGKKTE